MVMLWSHLVHSHMAASLPCTTHMELSLAACRGMLCDPHACPQHAMQQLGTSCSLGYSSALCDNVKPCSLGYSSALCDNAA